MEIVEITLNNGEKFLAPGDNWGRTLKEKGIQMYDVKSVYRV